MDETVETETQLNRSTGLTVEVVLRPWRVCARCGHAWKSRAARGAPRCRACEKRLRSEAEATSATLAQATAR
jgi:ribosomal protein L37AE/L43A